uniref:Uncharacterized protein n=1 Tax=Caenorhabditis japonica TaxID=281687 RepID=A0A8R1ESY6_CAEJA
MRSRLYVNYHHGHQWLKTGDSGVSTPNFTADLYCKQLTTVTEKIKGKMKLVYFVHHNVRPHVVKMTRQKTHRKYQNRIGVGKIDRSSTREFDTIRKPLDERASSLDSSRNYL